MMVSTTTRRALAARLAVTLLLVSTMFGAAGSRPAAAHSATSFYPAEWPLSGGSAVVTWYFTQSYYNRGQSYRDRATDAATTWTNIGRNMRYSFNSTIKADFDPASSCSTNAVHWGEADAAVPTVFGTTWRCTQGSQMVSMNIVVDDDQTWYTGTGSTPAGSVDLQQVLTHEFGHGTGFYGPCCSPDVGHFDSEEEGVCAVTIAPGVKDYYTKVRHTMCPGGAGSGVGSDRGRTPEPHEIETFHNAYGGSTWCGKALYGVIKDKFVVLGSAPGIMGCPNGEERDMDDYRARGVPFVNGDILWASYSNGAHNVMGAIRSVYYGAAGGPTVFGLPVTDETWASDNYGVYNDFKLSGAAETCGRGNGSIVSGVPSLGSGTHVVKGDIRAVWCSLGRETGTLGYPMTDETLTADAQGVSTDFVKPNSGSTCGQGTASVLSAAPTVGAGTHELHGGIRGVWCANGGVTGVGYPTTNESTLADGAGRYNHFLRVGGLSYCNGTASIFSAPASAGTGTQLIKDDIRRRYCDIGWESGATINGHFVQAGYPTGSQTTVSGLPSNPSGLQQIFQYLRIYSNTATGTHYVKGAILTRYLADGGPAAYGFPKTDEFWGTTVTGQQYAQSDFETASIRSYVNGPTVVCPAGVCP